MDTIFDGKNIAVATCGKTISNEQIQMLLNNNVSNVIIAFDADYTNSKERDEKFEEYRRTAKPLMNYFNVSIIMDYDKLLGYKDSPIDKGIEVFNKLMKTRVFL